ncbi:uncharacterized protein TNCV_674771 [Trichonephila clavipes]|nr:uncharacterized protein TNCV_674771 [Trichonephila clavipes]
MILVERSTTFQKIPEGSELTNMVANDAKWSPKMMPTWLYRQDFAKFSLDRHYNDFWVAGCVPTVAEWYRYRTVACLVMSSSPVPLKTRRVGQRCTLNLSRAETSSRWCGVVLRSGGASSGVIHVT